MILTALVHRLDSLWKDCLVESKPFQAELQFLPLSFPPSLLPFLPLFPLFLPCLFFLLPLPHLLTCIHFAPLPQQPEGSFLNPHQACPYPLKLLHPAHNTIPVPFSGYVKLPWPAPSSLHDLLPPHSSSNTPEIVPPQGLCTCHALPGSFFPHISNGSNFYSHLCSRVTSSERPSLTMLSKIAEPPFLPKALHHLSPSPLGGRSLPWH